MSSAAPASWTMADARTELRAEVTAARMCAASFVAASGIKAHAAQRRIAPSARVTAAASGFMRAACESPDRVLTAGDAF